MAPTWWREGGPLAAEHIATHIAEHGIGPAGVHRHWRYQANLAMNKLIAKRPLGREETPDESPVILDEFANTASAGSIIALRLHRVDLAAGDVGVISSFGAGYSIGSVVVRRA